MIDPQKILVVSLDNVGDAVMASAILAPLKSAFPTAQIGLWAKQYTAELFEGHPSLNKIHAADPFWDTSPGVPAGGITEFYRVLGTIRTEHYDTTVLLNTEWRRALSTQFAGIRQRIGYNRRHSRLFLTTAISPANSVQHFIDDHRVLLERGFGISIQPETCLASLALSATDLAKFDIWHRGHGVGAKQYWVAHLFSGDIKKNWPISMWLRLITDANERWPDRRCVVLLGPSEKDRLSASQMDLLSTHAHVVNSPSLGLLKTLLANACVVVDGDSGPGHVAAAVGTPVVSLFGPTNPLRSRPLGTAATCIVSAATVADIAVADVWRAMTRF